MFCIGVHWNSSINHWASSATVLMKLLIVNPNTTSSMTSTMVDAAKTVVSSDTQIVGATAAYGPESIEGYYDEVFSVPPLIETVRSHPDCDGVVVGCFDDTGVDALRCMTSVPVIGICQAAMQMATVVAGSFSVITTLARSVPALEHLALRYGYERHCRRVRASDLPVLALESDPQQAVDIIGAEIKRAIKEDGAEAIVLGCAGMADLSEKLSDAYGLPVVEGVTAAARTIESLHALGLRTSQLGGYATPRGKHYVGEFNRFAPQPDDG